MMCILYERVCESFWPIHMITIQSLYSICACAGVLRVGFALDTMSKNCIKKDNVRLYKYCLYIAN